MSRGQASPARSVRVLTVDDQAVFRGIAGDVIAATDGFEAVGEADSGAGALDAVPAAANESSAGLVGYLGALGAVNETAESVEPLALEAFAPPQPEDTEPEPVT